MVIEELNKHEQGGKVQFWVWVMDDNAPQEQLTLCDAQGRNLENILDCMFTAMKVLILVLGKI